MRDSINEIKFDEILKKDFSMSNVQEGIALSGCDSDFRRSEYNTLKHNFVRCDIIYNEYGQPIVV